MSSLACVVVSSLLGIVEQQLLLLLLPDDTEIMVSSLKEKLNFLQAYLRQSLLKPCDPAEAKKKVLVLHKEIRDVAVKAEDEIESKLGKVYLAMAMAKQQGKEECAVAVEAAMACEDLHHTLQQVVKDIECVEVRIRDLHLQQQQQQQQITVQDTPASSSSSSTPALQLEKYVVRDDDDLENIGMIGVEDCVEEIKDMLLPLNIQSSSSTPLRVVSIWGKTGTGTTTLAKTAYEHPSIMSHFGIRAWTAVSTPPNRRKLLLEILGCIVSSSSLTSSSSSSSEISNKDDDQLVEQLHKSLIGQRYLIVIDNLWDASEWKDICQSFPDNSNGSRVMITTRFWQLADIASSGMCVYQTRLLDLEESWSLLSKTAASSNGRRSCIPPKFESIGRCIVEKCGGIPLVIILIGGLLATLKTSPKHYWEDIERELPHNSSSRGTLIDHWLLYIIEVCYKYLPTHLKPCFLYFGAFPIGAEIHVKKLIKLWVAEGFLKLEVNKSLEEIAESYLCDLINRRLVQVHKRSLDGKIKSCMLHDLILQFCRSKAQDEDIMMNSYEYHDILEGYRWVSRQLGCWPVAPTYFKRYSSLQTRSLLHFGENSYLAKCCLIFPSLKFLRVLDLSLIKYWHGMPSEIVDLIHLRYLALTTIGSLYNFQFSKLQSLQTLILSSWTKECQLQLPACDVLDLPWLRHVSFDKGSSFYLPNLVQENLQTLSWFKVTGWDSRTTNFTKVPNLKELGIYIEGEVLPNALDSLAQLHQLEKLKVIMGRAERFNLPSSFPLNLKQLTLSNTYLSWEDMDTIGNLPNLDLLKLKDFAFCGPKWKPRDGGFLKLRFFLIERSDLEHWNANASHFPVLKRLILRYCWDLEKLPNDFKEVYTLRLIELDHCCSSLVTSAMEIRKWQRVSGNEALDVRDVTKIELPSDESSEIKE